MALPSGVLANQPSKGGELSDRIAHLGMKATVQHPDDFANAFARLQAAVETACAAEPGWSSQVAAAIRAALAFAAADPTAAQALTNDALAAGRAGFVHYERMLAHFAERLRPGRSLRPAGEPLPELLERALIGGIVTLVAQRVDTGHAGELGALALEAIEFILAPYLGVEEARRIAASYAG